MKTKRNYLNLGCGSTFHEDWTNIDFVSDSEKVIAHNLLDGIPFKNNSFSVVYHSHVLEHIPRYKSRFFIDECFRVLSDGGIIRVAIPDLEQIALNYIRFMQDSLKGLPGSDAKYEWTLLEMFDQMVRNKVGGEMVEYILDEKNGNDAFLLERNGREVQLIIDSLRKKNNLSDSKFSGTEIRRFTPGRIFRSMKRRIMEKILGDDTESLRVGRFRAGGEIHQWMYDRYSLKKILETAGFHHAVVVSAFESSIPDWNIFGLDGKENVVRKPDSLFMEARK